MRRLRVVGIGPGGPDQLTVEAVAALREVDVFLVPVKRNGTDDLVALRHAVLERHTDGRARVVEVPDPPRDRSPGSTGDTEGYERVVHDWHDARAEAFARAVDAHVPEDGVVGLLVWGDPALYDSTVRIVERMARRRAFDWDVVPGVSAVSLLAARHRLVLHRVGEPVTITTGRRLADTVAHGGDNLVVMLDGGLTCLDLEGDWEVWWGANLGTPDEELVHGRLADVRDVLTSARDRARAARGWVMDVYLLRRASTSGVGSTCATTHDGVPSA